MKRVYLDHAATTPLLDVAREAMTPWLDCGNPSSNHAEGRRAKLALDEARETFALALGCEFAEVVFTGSATEAANMATVGLALANPHRKHVLMSAAEHHCVLYTKPVLERLGCHVELVSALSDSTPDVEGLGRRVTEDTLLVAAMAVNNETGAVGNIEAEWRPRTGEKFVCDLSQGFPRKIHGLNEADVAFTAPHKFGGPKGVGVMVVRAPTKLEAIIRGGGQEREGRAGTENVAAIAGAAAALRWHLANGHDVSDRKANARAAFLRALGPHEFAVEDAAWGIEGTAFLWFEGCEADALLIRLDRAGIAASSGAACTSGSVEPSHVVVASGFSEARARQCVRFSFGWQTSQEDAAWAGAVVRREVEAIRAGLKPRPPKAG
jgi:cysteine desulfurase